jgi:hypothetical protein
MRQLDSGKRDDRISKRLEAHHRGAAVLDRLDGMTLRSFLAVKGSVSVTPSFGLADKRPNHLAARTVSS